MTTILDRLACHARERTRQAKENIPPAEIRRQALALPKGSFAFEKALEKPGISFICECKKASPSKGLIAPDFPYVQIAKDYEAAGADCISVLTEPKWFLGSDRYLREIADTVRIPCLRKDFTVDEYMIYEAKLLGASAVLLICSILTEKEIGEYISLCDELGLSALVEVLDETEVETALGAGARIIGVNNRNLKDFSVNTDNSLRLRKLTDKPLIQAFRIRAESDIANAGLSSADYVLLDSGAGTGKAFDWRLIRGFKKPFFLAGGLDPDNAGEAVRQLHPYGVDVSSGIETDGVKDKHKMAAFAAAVRKGDKDDEH